MNKLTKTGLIGLLATLIVVLALSVFNLPLAGTSPLFLVWVTLLLIGLSQKRKKE